MQADTQQWTADQGGLNLSALHVSFQRYPCPATGLVQDLPQSLGALPVAAMSPGRYLLPVDDGEAFWIGIWSEGLRFEISIAAHNGDSEAVDAINGRPAAGNGDWLDVPPDRNLPGIPQKAGAYRVFCRASAARPGLTALQLRARQSTTALVTLVTYKDYSEQTKQPAPGPLDPSDGYRGILLP